jgi:hypothetical protein
MTGPPSVARNRFRVAGTPNSLMKNPLGSANPGEESRHLRFQAKHKTVANIPSYARELPCPIAARVTA